MKSEFVQFVFVLIAIVVSAAAEELLPSFAGVGLPLLLALVVAASFGMKVLPSVMTAAGAGAFEDALSSLPPMTSVCFFVIAALVSRQSRYPRPIMLLLFPLHELWAGLCSVGPLGESFGRVLVALPLGAVATVVQRFALAWAERRAGIDE